MDQMSGILQCFNKALASGDLTTVESLSLPSVPERRVSAPAAFANGAVGRWLSSEPTVGRSVWNHQALALGAFVIGENVVLATGTASGKSLVFQAIAIHLMEKSDTTRSIIFYPLKALAADQLLSWQRALAAAGLPAHLVARVDGDVLADERVKALQTARILIMTPDVCHHWLMSNLANPVHKRFLSSLDLVVIDEAHVFESIFGSNFAFLFRRLHAARNFCRSGRSKDDPLRAVAASATIIDAAGHLTALTGLPFMAVGEEDDGSPRHDRSLLHIASKLGAERSLAATIQRELVVGSSTGSFITFIDSRQGAERVAVGTELENLVRPYRSGYEAQDRANIEQALRAGELRGVVSTSALELGINIPHFAVGLNIGVPASRKSFRQRLGRVGRTGPGAFAVIAEPYAFRRYGMTLEEYFAASVEPSHLYLQNRFMQFAHARCLAHELEMLGAGRKGLPAGISWPAGFEIVFDFSHLGGGRARPREFDHIAQLGGDDPHRNFPLRNVAEESFVVAHGTSQTGGPATRVGYLTLQQAIREAYPGAVYLHMACGWRVHEWRSTVFERSIRVSRWGPRALTRPLIRTFVNLSVERDGLVEGRFRQSTNGFLAECQLQITERVEGFVERDERKLYKDLRQEKPAMTAKTREFRTTGVVMRIADDWFTANGLKQRLADLIRDLLLREKSISSQDVDSAATNISMLQAGKRISISDAIVIYDATYGSLRLTEPVYTELETLIGRLERAMELTPEEAEEFLPGTIASLKRWHAELGPDSAEAFTSLMGAGQGHPSNGYLQIYAPGSILARRDVQGVLRDVEIIEPLLYDVEGVPQLFYRHKITGTATALIAADKLEVVGDNWTTALWNPDTGEFAELNDEPVEHPGVADRPVTLVDSLTVDEVGP
jgi:DEAD/DEAH box helicase domain-containing protein